VNERGGLKILRMSNEKAMRKMETSEVFSVLRMEFIRLSFKLNGEISAAICL
jgi:hypothetical protein